MISSPKCSDDFISWDEKNIHKYKKLKPVHIQNIHKKYGYEVLQGEGKVEGRLLGGCLDVFMMFVGTKIWPDIKKWKDAILFVETSEEKPSPDFVKWTFRNLAAQGILNVIKAIIVGKPQGEVFFKEYKESIMQVVSKEEELADLPIIYNVNFGHASPIGILPYGICAQIDCYEKTITLLENATIR